MTIGEQYIFGVLWIIASNNERLHPYLSALSMCTGAGHIVVALFREIL